MHAETKGHPSNSSVCLKEVRLPGSGHNGIKVLHVDATYQLYHLLDNIGLHGVTLVLSAAANAALLH